MRTEPRFVSPNDFQNYWGIDLDAELKGDSNNKSNRFLLLIEERLMMHIDSATFRLNLWEELTDFQKENLQKAILEQAMYVLKNSDISMDSGYDPDSGEVISSEKLEKIEICRNSINYLKICGLYNHVIRNRARFIRFF